MPTPLSLYGSNVAAAVVATGFKSAKATGGTETSTTFTLNAGASGWIELSPGITGTLTPAGSEPATPSGKQFFLDDTTLVGNSLGGGTFTVKHTLNAGFRNFNGVLIMRMWLWNGSTYTQFGSDIASSSQLFATSKTTYTWTGTIPIQAFASGQYFTYDILCHITTGPLGGSTTATNYWSNSGTGGVAGDAVVVTQGYTAGGGGGNPPVVGSFALVGSGTGIASFDHVRWTSYPDPSMSLATMSRVGSSLVNWNAILPSAATTFQPLVSTDGVNFSDMSGQNGGPLPGIAAQKDPWQDTFSVDNTASYTSTLGFSGSVSTWTIDTANSRLTATGGARGIFLYSQVSASDIDLLCDMDESDAGGLVWSYSDSGDYYSLAAADA